MRITDSAAVARKRSPRASLTSDPGSHRRDPGPEAAGGGARAAHPRPAARARGRTAHALAAGHGHYSVKRGDTRGTTEATEERHRCRVLKEHPGHWIRTRVLFPRLAPHECHCPNPSSRAVRPEACPFA